MNHNKTFSYIVIGAGSAGCVLANRLSQDPGNQVLILEAGPMDSNLMIHIPAGVHKVYKDPRINWNYQTDAEQALDKRNLDTPRGKVVGGSSSINSMVYMRGHPLDFDRWADKTEKDKKWINTYGKGFERLEKLRATKGEDKQFNFDIHFSSIGISVEWSG